MSENVLRVVEVGDRSTAQHCPECDEWQRSVIRSCHCGRWINDIGGIESPRSPAADPQETDDD